MEKHQYRVFQYPKPDSLKADLLKMIEDLRTAFPWSRLAVQTNGWSSPKGDWLGDWHCPALETIKGFILEKLPDKKYEMHAWFNILEPGGTVKLHNHFKADIATVYHISGPGDLILSGLVDGHGGTYRTVLLPPLEGRIAIFSGMTNHAVPGPVTERRLSLAINFHRNG